MGINENILNYLSVYGKEDKYKLARKLKTDVAKITKALDLLQQERRIEIKEGKAMLVKKQPKVKEEKPPEEVKEEIAEESEAEEPTEEEQPKEEVSEEPAEEEIPEHFGVKEEGKRVKGTVKFFNPNKGFGFITGDDGKEYYVNESGLKEGVDIDSGDRVSFKVVYETQGPKAEEVEKISKSEENAS